MPWDRSNHKWPCSETDVIDSILNELEQSQVSLMPEEIEQAWSYAKRRRSSSIGLRDRMVSKKSPLFVDAIGVMGEMAVCRYLGIKYTFTVNTFRKADLLSQIEVRTTEWLNGHCKVRPDDDNFRIVVMAIYTKKWIYLPGWILASDGKKYPVKDPHQVGMLMHFVPQHALNSMKTLSLACSR